MVSGLKNRILGRIQDGAQIEAWLLVTRLFPEEIEDHEK
jgi:hypothetical protein